LHCYRFYHNEEKVWEYEREEPATDEQILTTRRILAGEVEGFGEPLNVPLEEISCIYSFETITMEDRE
jgi:hypothetical protein